MSVFLRSNFGYGFLASSLGVADVQMTLDAGHLLPIIAGSFRVVIWNCLSYPNPITDPNMEIVTASYSGTVNVYNITRAQESTTQHTHTINSKVAMTYTAGVSSADLYVIGTKEVDETGIGSGKCLYYNSTTGYIQYTNLTGGGDMLKSIYDPDADGVIIPPQVDISGFLGSYAEYSIENDAVNKKLRLVGDVASPGNSKVYGTSIGGVRGWQSFSLAGSIAAAFSGGTANIAVGTQAWVYVPYNCTVTGWTILADRAASAPAVGTNTMTVDIWKSTYADYPPTAADKISGSESPYLSATLLFQMKKNQDTSLSTWSTTSISAGDVVLFNVTTNMGALAPRQCVVSLEVTKT